MRNHKKLLFVKIAVTFAVLFIASAVAFAQAPPGKSDMGFLYAFGAYVGPQGKGKVIPVQNETTLRAGDRLKLFFEPKSDQHFYLLHISSQGELTPLFPAAATIGSSWTRTPGRRNFSSLRRRSASTAWRSFAPATRP